MALALTTTAVTAVTITALALTSAAGAPRFGPARTTALALAALSAALTLPLTTAAVTTVTITALAATATATAARLGRARRRRRLAAPTAVSADRAARASTLVSALPLRRGLRATFRSRTLSRRGTLGGRRLGRRAIFAPVLTTAATARVLLAVGRRAGQKRQHERGSDGLLHLMLRGAGIQPVLLVPFEPRMRVRT